jgi:hypothetical protein
MANKNLTTGHHRRFRGPTDPVLSEVGDSVTVDPPNSAALAW